MTKLSSEPPQAKSLSAQTWKRIQKKERVGCVRRRSESRAVGERATVVARTVAAGPPPLKGLKPGGLALDGRMYVGPGESPYGLVVKHPLDTPVAPHGFGRRSRAFFLSNFSNSRLPPPTHAHTHAHTHSRMSGGDGSCDVWHAAASDGKVVLGHDFGCIPHPRKHTHTHARTC